MIQSEFASASALVGAPGRDAVAAQDHADGVGVGVVHGGDVETELEAGSAPGDPDHPVPVDLLGQPLPVRRRGHCDPAVGMQVVDVGRSPPAVHGCVDGGRRGTPPVQAEVEGGHHLVFAFLTRVDLGQGPQPVQPQHGQAFRPQRAQIAAGALDPEQFDVTPVTGSTPTPLADVFPPP